MRLAAAGLALDRGPGALALRDLRADRLRLRRREADKLQAGADGGEVVALGFAWDSPKNMDASDRPLMERSGSGLDWVKGENPCVCRGARTQLPDTASMLCSTAPEGAETIYGASLEFRFRLDPTCARSVFSGREIESLDDPVIG